MKRLRCIRGALAVLLAGLTFLTGVRAQPLTLPHIHGLAYTVDGKSLVVASHEGLAAFERGRWARKPGPPREYTGFSASRRGFYSSGHAPGSVGTAHPLGIVRSSDGGKGWEDLGLAGEADFNLLAASWNREAIYVWSPVPNSHMRQPGLHRTFDGGRGWQVASASGLDGDPQALAVHPDKPELVALATSKGIFESVDSGESFLQLAGRRGTAVFYDLDGQHLWYGIDDGRARLARARLRAGPVTWMPLPSLGEGETVAYVAQSPVSRTEYAIATTAHSVYVSNDAARNWSQIVDRGAPIRKN